jgi:Rrf2 family transcriptional regulator, iron-sulfur cluster assembly transcription factor
VFAGIADLQTLVASEMVSYRVPEGMGLLPLSLNGRRDNAMMIRQDRTMTAISVMVDIAFHAGRSNTVSAADIAERMALARRGMEPLLQALSRAGLIDSIRGPRGGYRLGRPARDIRLSEIVAVISGEEEDTAHMPSGRLQEVATIRLWQELDEAVTTRLAALTLEDLLRRAAAAGLRRPAMSPITFAI